MNVSGPNCAFKRIAGRDFSRAGYVLSFGNPMFNQLPNWCLHLTPLRGAGEAGR